MTDPDDEIDWAQLDPEWWRDDPANQDGESP